MDDALQLCDVTNNQMELLLESDEEEASLLEEMERQEAFNIYKSSNHKEFESENHNASLLSNLHLTEKEDFHKTSNCNSLTVDLAPVQEHLEESCEAKCVPKHEKRESETSENSLDSEHDQLFQKSLLGNLVYTNKDFQKDTPTSELKENNGEVQILQLNISESDLIMAKSAAALQAQMEDSTPSHVTFSPHFLSLPDTHGGHSLKEDVYTNSETCGTQTSNNSGNKRKNPNTDYLRAGKRRKKSKVDLKKSATASEMINVMEGLPMNGLISKSPSRQDHRFPGGSSQVRNGRLTSNTKTFINAASSFGATTLTDSAIPTTAVNFSCHYCKFKCPFTKKFVESIMQHINPPERCNQVMNLPENLNSFKETVKLSMMIAKNKSKAQVRLASRVECTQCHQQFAYNFETSEQIVVHYHWCHKTFGDAKTIVCLYCKELVPRGYIRKHLQQKSKKKCKKIEGVILQMMSCVCQKYAEEHKPVCVVCNERQWPYRGHRSDLDPVCEPCRFNITSGNTTKLVRRDVTGCAICGLHCAEKYVTYWASEMESLFIGESCIRKLKSPKTREAEELIKSRTTKLQSLIQSTLESFVISEDAEAHQNSQSSTFVQDHFNRKLDADPCTISRVAKLVTTNSLGENSNSTNIAEGNVGVPVTNVLPFSQLGAKGSFVPMTGSFKILNSRMSLPFSYLTPKTSILASKSLKDIVSQESNLAPKGIFVPLVVDTPCQAKKGSRNIILKSFKTDSVAATADHTNMDSMQLKAVPNKETKISEGNNTVESELEGNILANLSPSQLNSDVDGDLNTNKSCSSANPTISFDSFNKPQQPKYVIKYVTEARGKPVGGNKSSIIGVKDHIVIKTSSNASPRVSTGEPPRLAEVIKTAKSVCESAWDRKGVFLKKRRKRKQIIAGSNCEEIILLD